MIDGQRRTRGLAARGDLQWAGVSESEIALFLENACPPVILEVNPYVTSERYWMIRSTAIRPICTAQMAGTDYFRTDDSGKMTLDHPVLVRTRPARF